MNLSTRLSLLAPLSPLFEEFTGSFDHGKLLHWVSRELGHAEVLDAPQTLPSASHPTMARALSPTLVVLSGNTSHAALQSLLRALLLGAPTHFKLPHTPLPEMTHVLAALPAELRALITLTHTLPEQWQEHFEALVVYGSDETIQWFSQRVPAQMRFLKHGHRLAIGLISQASEEAALLAARDASLFDQQGCLSLHNIYLAPDCGSTPLDFSAQVAAAMDRFATDHPRNTLSLSEAGAISNLRETTRYLAATQPENHGLFESKNGTDWTVIFQSSPTIQPSCLNRVVYVKPWPEDLALLGPETRYLSALALFPWTETPAPSLLRIAPPRLCPLGSCQTPPVDWHHDGFLPLASLVKWTDLA